ncbi:DNA ligase [Helicobacter saguini]|uniref:DNA ligase n=1 Tax=Helicobacter saguini TaxID=1548018 RepID=A0A347VP12_9HELI|nr:DNA ligase [Helicobacter saguini]MWV61553.1 DNA ligase [Helicobacter saguini]MWV67777.1 DNA ligase [Helicobacter saguini]MWV70755.1 DNA ligase [Helicobacter saguini]MWV72659.1 DNA ligase [Helicobacter saguini]TLD94537.1 DNA ligase [Helicobacter saguini]
MFRICLIKILFFITLFAKDSNILLLKNFDSKIINDKNIKEFLVSEKLDGIRALWNGKNFYSRNGNVINAPKCFTQGYPKFFLDGELWSKRGDFNNIISATNKANPSCEEWSNLNFYVFDVPHFETFDGLESIKIKELDCNKITEKLCFLESRLQILRDFLKGKVTTIRILRQEKLDSISALYSKLDSINALNGEGLVLRKNHAPYTSGRSNYNFKLKKFQDSECKIKEITQGKGKFQGKMGAIICTQTLESFSPNIHPKLNDSNKNELIEFKIGSGFSDNLRANPPKVGTIITYKFQGFSKNGLPKFPVFLRIYKE